MDVGGVVGVMLGLSPTAILTIPLLIPTMYG